MDHGGAQSRARSLGVRRGPRHRRRGRARAGGPRSPPRRAAAPAASATARGAIAASTPIDRDRSAVIAAPGLSLGAAAIHLAAAPSHYVELGDLGAGFLAAAVLQAAWARSILGGATRRTIVSGSRSTRRSSCAWLVSRTIGLPVGPTPGVAEPVGLPDGARVAFEVLISPGLAVRWLDVDRAPVRQVARRGRSSR